MYNSGHSLTIAVGFRALTETVSQKYRKSVKYFTRIKSVIRRVNRRVNQSIKDGTRTDSVSLHDQWGK